MRPTQLLTPGRNRFRGCLALEWGFQQDSNDGMSLSGNKIRRFLALSRREKLLLLIAASHLARARAEFSRVPLASLLARLQRPGAPTAAADPDFDVALAGWAIRTAAGAVPWRSDCLIQCLAADRWLRRHGVVADFRLGVAPTAGGSILGHAWMECDGVVLTGGTAVAGYEVLIGE